MTRIRLGLLRSPFATQVRSYTMFRLALQRTPLGHFQLYLKGLDGDALTVSRRHVAGVRKMMQSLH